MLILSWLWTMSQRRACASNAHAHQFLTCSLGAQVSKAASSLCMWVHAMDVYSKVAKEVEPKRQRLKEMNDQLDSANALLLQKQNELQVRALLAWCCVGG